MLYHDLCHKMRNLIQAAEGMVIERMKAHRDLRVLLDGEKPPGVLYKQLLNYFCRMDELDAGILSKTRQIELVLCEVIYGRKDQEGREHSGDLD